MGRATLEMSPLEIMVEMAEGNPGAAVALAEIFAATPKIDPQCAFGGLNVILTLDDMGIYGSRIWCLWKDVCGRDPVKVLAMLRARQLGSLAGVTQAAINHAIDNRGEGIDHKAILAAVKAELTQFNAQPVAS